MPDCTDLMTGINFADSSNFNFDANKIEFTGTKAQLKLIDNTGLTFNQTYDNDTGFTYNSSEAEFTGGQVQQKLNDRTGLTFNQPFTNDTGFIYDSAKAEFTGGLVRQIDQRPANSIVGATYTSSLNANFGADGFVDLTGNTVGSPTIDTNRLACLGYANNSVYYSDTLIGNLSGDFVIKFKYTPNYTTAPAQNTQIIELSTGSGATDRVTIFNSPSGNNLRITATGLSAQTFGAWSPVSGTVYTFEVHCVSNSVTLFVDDVQIGGAKVISPSQGTSAVRLYVGAGTLYSVANGYWEDVILYSTASQTSSYTVPESAFLESKVECPQFSYTELGNIQGFTNFATTENNTPRYVINDLYYSGGWVSSNGTYAQASSASDILTNIATLPASDTVDIDVIFGDGSSQMDVDDLTLTYTGQEVLATKVELPQFIYSGGGAIQAFTNYASSETGSPKYVLNDLYYNSGWVSSDGSYAQSNTVAEILTNIATLPASDTLDIDITFDASTSTQSAVSDTTMTYTGQIYPTDDPTIQVNAGFQSDNICSYTDTSTITGLDNIRIIFNVDSVEKYWNGSAWVDSDGTYAQSNPKSDLTSTVTQQLLSTGALIKLKWFLHSDDGSTTPDITQAVLAYSYYPGGQTLPTRTVLYGFVHDVDNGVESSVTITAKLKTDGKYNNEIQYTLDEITATPDSTGYWDMSIVNNANMLNLNGVYDPVYQITFTFASRTVTYEITLPNETAVNFVTLL